MKNRACFYFVLIFVFTGSIDLTARNIITVATIGTAPSFNKNQDPQVIVDQVIEFWKLKLDQVLPDKPDLIVLPEFCDMSQAGDEYLSIRKNQITDFFASTARENRCYIAFGTKREADNGKWFNSVIILDREGSIAGIYDKNFPTIWEMEGGTLAGLETPVFDLDFGSVAVAICFDLNFDELRNKYVAANPDIIIFSSMYHGGFVQKNWAYTCRAFFIGSIWRGTPSEIRNPLGEVVATSTNYFDFAVTKINLDSRLVHLDYNSSRLKAMKEKYGTSVTISDPGKLGAVLVASEDENIKVKQMIEEFNIELLDDYFKRVHEMRNSKWQISTTR